MEEVEVRMGEGEVGVVTIAPPPSSKVILLSILSTLRTKLENKHFNILTFDLQFLFLSPPLTPRIPPAFQATSPRLTMIPPSLPGSLLSNLPPPKLNTLSKMFIFYI